MRLEVGWGSLGSLYALSCIQLSDTKVQLGLAPASSVLFLPFFFFGLHLQRLLSPLISSSYCCTFRI